MTTRNHEYMWPTCIKIIILLDYINMIFLLSLCLDATNFIHIKIIFMEESTRLNVYHNRSIYKMRPVSLLNELDVNFQTIVSVLKITSLSRFLLVKSISRKPIL